MRTIPNSQHPRICAPHFSVTLQFVWLVWTAADRNSYFRISTPLFVLYKPHPTPTRKRSSYCPNPTNPSWAGCPSDVIQSQRRTITQILELSPQPHAHTRNLIKIIRRPSCVGSTMVFFKREIVTGIQLVVETSLCANPTIPWNSFFALSPYAASPQSPTVGK